MARGRFDKANLSAHAYATRLKKISALGAACIRKWTWETFVDLRIVIRRNVVRLQNSVSPLSMDCLHWTRSSEINFQAVGRSPMLPFASLEDSISMEKPPDNQPRLESMSPPPPPRRAKLAQRPVRGRSGPIGLDAFYMTMACPARSHFITQSVGSSASG